MRDFREIEDRIIGAIDRRRETKTGSHDGYVRRIGTARRDFPSVMCRAGKFIHRGRLITVEAID
jgi:hypothetical protein